MLHQSISSSPLQQYGWKLPPYETFRVLLVGEQASCNALLGALLRREDLLRRAVGEGDAAEGSDQRRHIVEEKIQSHGQVLNFILDERFLSNHDEEEMTADNDEDITGDLTEPRIDGQSSSDGILSAYLSPMRRLASTTSKMLMNGVAASPPHAAAVSDAELEETVRRRRKNDAILQFIQDKSQKLDLVWYCFSHQNWTDSNTRKEAKMRREADFIQRKLGAETPVLVVHVLLSPYESDLGKAENANAVRWMSNLRASMKQDGNPLVVLPAHLGSDERDSHLEAVAKETVWSFVKHQCVQLPGGSVYNGDVVRGKVHGFGKEEGPGGDSFLGDWVSGLKHGFGTVRYGNGDKYEGTWEAGMRHGNGRYTWPSGRYFDGIWAQAKREGPGCLVFPDKSKCDGVWVDDKPVGPGKITYENGDSYFGSILFQAQSNSSLHPIDYVVSRSGEGEMHYVEGSRYVGTFDKDQRNGYGMYVFADGERYQGMWKNNQRHGYGSFQYNEGTVFEGTWWQDGRRGEGRLCLANGDVVVGSWQGEQISQATYTKGSLAQATKSSQRLLTNTLKTAKKLGQGELIVYAQKWTGFFRETDATPKSPVTLTSFADLAAFIGSQDHPLGQPVARFVNTFEALYGDFAEEDVIHLIPTAVDDVASFITYGHGELIKRTRWEPPLSEKEGNKLILMALKEAVFSRIYPRLFSLYRIKNRKKDILFKAKLDSLWRVMPRDLGIQMAWESEWVDEAANGSPKSALQARHRNRRTGSLSGLDIPSSLQTAKHHPFLAAIRSLRSVEGEYTLRGKLQCLMDCSKHILVGCSPQKQKGSQPHQNLSSLGRSPLVYIGAEEKFPVFVFVVIKAKVSDLHAHADMLSDFLPQQTITKTEGGYRLTELKAAMEFVMKLHPNLRNASGELVPLSTIKNDLKLAVASARQRLVVHQREVEAERERRAAQSEEEAKTAAPSSSYRDFLRSRSHGRATSGDGHFKMGFLVDLLKEVAHRDATSTAADDFYAPITLEPEEQRMLRNEAYLQLLQSVLSSIGMAIVTVQPVNQPPSSSPSTSLQAKAHENGAHEQLGRDGDGGEEEDEDEEAAGGKEKRAKSLSHGRLPSAGPADGPRHPHHGLRLPDATGGGKPPKPEMRLEITRRLPLWVYNQLADTLALHLP